MALFLSTFVNKVDRKGRVSVPATFRTTLGRTAANEAPLKFVAYPGIDRDGARVLIASSEERMTKYSDELETIDYDSDRAEFLKVILQETKTFDVDGDGRTIIPADLLALIGVSEECAFVGQGREFLICHPDLPKRRAAKVRA